MCAMMRRIKSPSFPKIHQQIGIREYALEPHCVCNDSLHRTQTRRLHLELLGNSKEKVGHAHRMPQ